MTQTWGLLGIKTSDLVMLCASSSVLRDESEVDEVDKIRSCSDKAEGPQSDEAGGT